MVAIQNHSQFYMLELENIELAVFYWQSPIIAAQSKHSFGILLGVDVEKLNEMLNIQWMLTNVKINVINACMLHS